MRVAYILNSFPRTSETFIIDEISSVIKSGIDCHVFSLSKSKSEDEVVHAKALEVIERVGVTYVRSCGLLGYAKELFRMAIRHPFRFGRVCRCLLNQSERRWYTLRSLWLMRELERLKVERMHVHFASAAAQYALTVHRLSGIPFTVTAHHHDVFFAPPNNFDELALASDGIFCISEFNRKYISNKYSVEPSKLRIVHCGIETERFVCDRPIQVERGECVKILCVARLDFVKGHNYLLDAVKILVQEGLNVKVSLVGDGTERENLESQCNRLGLLEVVEFLGFKEQSDVLQLYCTSDIVVLASLSEGIPVSLMEAMSCQRLVIATAVRGVPELVEDKLTGCLIPSGDPVAIAETIKWVVDHPNDAKRIAESARNKVVREFNRELSTKKLINIWQGKV